MKLPPLPSGWRIDATGVLTDETGVERYVRLPDGKTDRLKIAVILGNFGNLEDYAQAWRGNAELLDALKACQSNMRVLAKAAGQFIPGSCYVSADEAANAAIASVTQA